MFYSKGTLHGINSATGQVLWTNILDTENFVPYKDNKVPIFLLRGTAFYQWASQAAVVFNLRVFNLKNKIIRILIYTYTVEFAKFLYFTFQPDNR